MYTLSWMKKAIYKVPNGKLLKIFLEEAEGKIVTLKITGDFFVYPEESIEELEKALLGVMRDEASLKAAIATFLEKKHPTLFGVDGESLVSTIISAAWRSVY